MAGISLGKDASEPTVKKWQLFDKDDEAEQFIMERTSLLQSLFSTYIFYDDDGLCYTLFRKNKVITFAHGHGLQLEWIIQIYSASKVLGTSSTPIRVRVTEINTLMDFVILDAEADICEDSPCLRFPFMGQKYFQTALMSPSIAPSFQDGVITSVTLAELHCKGSVNQKLDGQKGCGCFSSVENTLIGIVVGYEQSDFPSGQCITRIVAPGSFF
jgi:hypothetical protein